MNRIVIGLSFSNFGGVFVTFSFGVEGLPERVVAELVGDHGAGRISVR